VHDWKFQLFVVGVSIVLNVGAYRIFGWLPPTLPDLEFGRSSLQETLLSNFIFLMWVFLTYWMSVLVHELGHAVFGYVAGFTFHFLRVGKFSFSREHGKWRVYYVPKEILGGAYSCFPRNEKNLQQRWILMCFGGVVFNFLMVLVGFIFIVWFASERIELWNSIESFAFGQTRLFFRQHPIHSDILKNILGAGLVWFVLHNLIAVFINLFPFRFSSGQPTDGLHILGAWKNDATFQYTMCFLLLQGARLHKIPIWQWKPHWIETSLTHPSQTPEYANVLYLAHVYAVDTNQLEKARDYTSRIKAIGEHLGWKEMQGLTLEMAWFTAWHEQNSEQAKAFLEIGKKTDLPTFAKKRAEAAIAFADGDLAQARALVEAGLLDYQERGSPYLGAFEVRGLEAMRLQMQA
jgi:hypothetical protein